MSLWRVKTGASLTRKVYRLHKVWTLADLANPERDRKYFLQHDWPALYEAVEDLLNEVQKADPNAKKEKTRRSYRFLGGVMGYVVRPCYAATVAT